MKRGRGFLRKEGGAGAQTGFADRERVRRAFLRAFGQPPQASRRTARMEEGALAS